MKKQPQKILILDNIRSVYNVGSIFRTSDAIGIDEIILVGTTPTPLDRFGRPRKDLAKVALGAEKNIKWKYYNNDEIVDKLKGLKDQQNIIVSLEQNKNSIDYKKVNQKIEEISEKIFETKKYKGVVVVVGNEVKGVGSDYIKHSDIIAEIPMRGKKESLNVSVSTGIFLFSIFDK
jgi:23S rRNA (guanosine2251-2'-O)-methyltransferase